MNIRTLAVVAGVGAPLILAAPATAGFLGIHGIAMQPDGSDLWVYRVYAEFGNPGEDRMLAVAGTANSPLLIQVQHGSFYQHQFGTDRPPLDFWVEAFPSLAYDTFVTIGVKCAGELPGCQPQDNMIITPGFPGFRSTVISTDNSGWAITPNDPQGDPFDPINCFPGDGRVMIGQFTTRSGCCISGTMLLQFFSDGVIGQTVASFIIDTTCSSDLQCSDGDPCNGIEQCCRETDSCVPVAPSPDCNGNGVLDSCDIDQDTSDDRNGNGVPDECECSGDLDGDGDVGIVDFLFLLASWGPCPTPCPPTCVADIASSPGEQITFDCTVDINDMLSLLGNWGRCFVAGATQ
ncbi:MAG: hypothetical protein E2O40_05985 [Planctomycetota bacterium]|nr:MAG: hypothetical protein E2O40_05985 [Planctomycetota bacterium]